MVTFGSDSESANWSETAVSKAFCVNDQLQLRGKTELTEITFTVARSYFSWQILSIYFQPVFAKCEEHALVKVAILLRSNWLIKLQQSFHLQFSITAV